MKQIYFKSTAYMYMFALLETVGKIQLDLLGANYNHYEVSCSNIGASSDGSRTAGRTINTRS